VWSPPSWSGLDDEIILVATGGVVIRTGVRQISSQGRDATGVRIMNLSEGQTVAAVAPVLAPTLVDDTPA
jgi:DNA gyrase subunit A